MPNFFGSPIFGGLSDRYGRKKVLVLTLGGTGIGYLISGLAIANNHVGLLIFSRLLTGFFEGNMGIAQASISDLKMDKHLGLGAVLATSALGYLVGPLIGGFLCDRNIVPWFDYSIPFYCGTAIAVVLGIGVAIFYQETYRATGKNTSLLSELNVSSKLKRVFRRPDLRNAFWVSILLALSVDCYYEFYPAYMVKQWEMTPKSIGLYSVTLSLALSLGSLWVPQLLKRKTDPASYRPTLAIFYALSLLGLLFVTGPVSLNLHFFMAGLTHSTLNTIQAVIVSNRANANEQGEVMGLQWGLRMLGDSALCVIGSFLLMQDRAFPIILSIILAIVTIGLTVVQTWNWRGNRLLNS